MTISTGQRKNVGQFYFSPLLVTLALLLSVVLGVEVGLASTLSPSESNPSQNSSTSNPPASNSPSQRQLQTFVRVIGVADGVCSPRGSYNIYLRASRLKGLRCFRFDIPHARFTLDFAPGRKVSESEIRRMVIKAGYTPGPIKIQELPLSEMNTFTPGELGDRYGWCGHKQSVGLWSRWFGRSNSDNVHNGR